MGPMGIKTLGLDDGRLNEPRKPLLDAGTEPVLWQSDHAPVGGS